MYKSIVFAGTRKGMRSPTGCPGGRWRFCPVWLPVWGPFPKGDEVPEGAGRTDGSDRDGRLDPEEAPDFVIDATHPYAAEVTENIRKACQTSGTEYLRLLRQASDPETGAVYVDSVEEARSF